MDPLVRIKRAILAGRYAFSEKARREYLYVIYGSTLAVVMVYSKGKFVRENGEEVYYFLVSSKRAM